jgi:hypothetical protein
MQRSGMDVGGTHMANVIQGHNGAVLSSEPRKHLTRLAVAHIPKDPVRAVGPWRNPGEVGREVNPSVRYVDREYQ